MYGFGCRRGQGSGLLSLSLGSSFSLSAPLSLSRLWAPVLACAASPPSLSLQGYNRNSGELIALRLRSHQNSNNLLSWEHVLGTMLHELSHIVFGPHDKNFYRLLDELSQECDELQMRGITGLGPFECEGFRSGGLSRSALEMKELMLNKALQRQKISSLMGSGRLGGAVVPPGRSVRELAAEAAERRARDDAWCGTDRSHTEDTEQEQQKAHASGRSAGGGHFPFLACRCGVGCPSACSAGAKRPRDGRALHDAGGGGERASGSGADAAPRRRRGAGPGPISDAAAARGGAAVVDLTGAGRP